MFASVNIVVGKTMTRLIVDTSGKVNVLYAENSDIQGINVGIKIKIKVRIRIRLVKKIIKSLIKLNPS